MSAGRRARRWTELLLDRGAREARRSTIARRREIARLQAMPRFVPTSTDLAGTRVEIVDAASFLWTYSEIYERRLYEFRSPNQAPRIIDGGANIGLSVLFFKSLFPRAQVICFEPDPAIRVILERNLRASGLDDVRVEPFALWSGVGGVRFASDGADGGRVVQRTEPALEVPTARLGDYLGEPVDLLKLDIEGAETEVLRDAGDRLHAVQRIYVEYHSSADRPQDLHVLLGILNGAGFRLHITPAAVSPQPFLARRCSNGFDMQLHVFGYRD